MTQTNTELKKGQIWHINPGKTTTTGSETWSNRPAIIVSNNVTCEKARFVEVVYLTTQKRKHRLPTHVDVISGDKKAIAMCEQTHTVDKSRIGFYIGSVDPTSMLEIDRALMFSLGIANTTKPSTIFKKWANAVDRYNVDLTESENQSDESAVNSDFIKNADGVTVKIKELVHKCAVYRNMYKMEHTIRKNQEETFNEVKKSLESLKNMYDLENVLSVLNKIGQSASNNSGEEEIF